MSVVAVVKFAYPKITTLPQFFLVIAIVVVCVIVYATGAMILDMGSDNQNYGRNQQPKLNGQKYLF